MLKSLVRLNKKHIVDDETSSDDDDFLPPVLSPRPAISTTSNQQGTLNELISRDVDLSEIFQ